jgi:hypothetical protein
MSADPIYRLSVWLLLVVAVVLIVAGTILILWPGVAPAGQGPNADGVRMVGGVLGLAGIIKIAVAVALQRFRYRIGALNPPPE